MKFRVDRDVLAEAVTWTARSLPTRPPVPVLECTTYNTKRAMDRQNDEASVYGTFNTREHPIAIR